MPTRSIGISRSSASFWVSLSSDIVRSRRKQKEPARLLGQAPLKNGGSRLRKEVDRAGLLDRTGDLPVKLRGNSGHATWKDLAGLGRELRKKVRIGVNHLCGRNIVTAARHLPVGLTEIDTALDCFWLGHENGLAKFAVKGTALEEVVELHFLQTARSAQTLFVARGDVTGRRLALGLGLGAFKDDDIAWHGRKIGTRRML